MRSISGHALIEISKHAGDEMKGYYHIVLPLAYFGARDQVPEIRKIWEQLWEDNTAGNVPPNLLLTFVLHVPKSNNFLFFISSLIHKDR